MLLSQGRNLREQGHLVLQIRFICVYIFRCRSELRSRYFGKTLASINENQSQNRKLNNPEINTRVYSTFFNSKTTYYVEE